MRITVTLSALACAVAVAVAAGSAAATGPALVKTAAAAKLGRILVDARGRTLYLFAGDRGGKSACYGSCAATWPPYLATGKPRAGSGASAALLATAKRRDGSLQVTYAGHPLYAYSLDRKAGDASGEAVAGKWYAVSPQGTKVKPAAASSSGGGGYGNRYGGN